MQATYDRPPFNEFPLKLSMWQMMQKHKPQSNSIAGGLLLFAAGSFQAAWTVWSPFVSQIWLSHSSGTYQLMLMSLHLAAIVGGFVGALLVNRFQKKTIYYSCAVLMSVGNILIIAWYDEAWALIAGRVIIGLPHGIVYVALVAHAGENSVPEMRGRVVAGIGVMQSISVLIYLLSNMSFDYYSSIDGNLLVGIVSLLWVGLAVAFTPCFTHESVVYMLQSGCSDAEVTDTMCKLRNESSLTWSVQNDLDELKRQLADEATRLDAAIWRSGNGQPLLVVAVLRFIYFLTNNILLNAVQIGFLRTMWPMGGPTGGALLIAGVRCVGTLMPTFLMDKLGRKKHVVVLGAGGVALLVLAIVLTLVDQHGMTGLLVLVALMHGLFGAGGAETLPHVVAAEAFALRKKSWSLATTAAVEHLLHVASVAVLLNLPGDLMVVVYYAMLYVAAGIIVGLCAWLMFAMPETRTMTLAQCRDEFVGGRRAGVVVYAGGHDGGAQCDHGITYSNAAGNF